MGYEIRKPNHLKFGQMVAILSKTVWFGPPIWNYRSCWYQKENKLCRSEMWTSSIQLFFCGKSSGKTTPSGCHISCSWKKYDVSYCWRLSGVRVSARLAEREGANCILLDPIPMNATLTFYCIFMSMFWGRGDTTPSLLSSSLFKSDVNLVNYNLLIDALKLISLAWAPI